MSSEDGRLRPRGFVAPLLLLVWIGIHGYALFLSGTLQGAGSSLWMWGAPTTAVLHRLGALSRAYVDEGAWGRLVTYGFLHGFVLHLLLNGWVWWAVGRFLETIVGSSRLWIVFVLSVVGGGVAHVWFEPGLVVGASGGVFGAVGAMGLWSIRSRHPAAKAARRTVLTFLILSVALFLLPNVGHYGHLGGFVTGALTMALLGPRRSERGPSLLARVVAVVLLLLVGASAFLQADESTPMGRAAFVQELRATEAVGRRLFEEPRIARPEKRAAFGRRLAALASEPWLEDWEGGPAFRAYVEAWQPIVVGHVPDPFVFEAALKKAHARWAPFERQLLRVQGGR